MDPDNCSFTDFDPPTFAWRNSAKHDFNQEGIALIVDAIFEMSVCDEYRWGYTLKHHEEPFLHCVQTYIVTLSKRYKKAQRNMTEIDLTVERLANSSDTRRHRVRHCSLLIDIGAPFLIPSFFQLLGRRSYTCVVTPGLRHLLPSLRAAGADAMSSDDEEVEITETGAVSRFKVAVKPWRSAKLTNTVRTIDIVGASTIPRDPRGGKLRERVDDPEKISGRPAPKRKPRNFYDSTWYNGLSPLEKRALKPKPPMDLNIPTWAKAYVLPSVRPIFLADSRRCRIWKKVKKAVKGKEVNAV